MRKTIINQDDESGSSFKLNFLDLEHLAQVEITSECREYPIESALLLTEDSDSGWGAASPGEQMIRIVFDQPQTVEHIILRFDEQQQPRTQEFVLSWLRDRENAYREILRQQFHFSPPDTASEIEHYQVNLKQLKTLELKIIPDINGGAACAGLKRLRLA